MWFLRPTSPATLAALQLLASAAQAQMSAPIADRPACVQCSITISPRTRFIPDHGTAPGTLASIIGWVGGGRYLIGTGGGGPPTALDSLGRSLGPLGRRGSGPGEFQSAVAFATGPEDSLAIADPANGRVHIVDRALRVTRSWTIPQNVVTGGIIWIPGQSILAISGLRATPVEVGYSVHLYSTTGSHLASLGEHREGPTRTASPLESARLLALAPDGTLLTVTTTGSYRLQKWDLVTRRLLREWTREAPWFERSVRMFRPRVLSAVFDDRGLLWTLVAVLADDWEKGVRPRVIGGVERSFEILDRELVLDSVVEAIDLEKGEVVARLRTPRLYAALLPGGRLAAESDDPRAGPGFDLFQVGLREP